MTKICKTCGNEILNNNYKYCSDGCKPNPEGIKKYYKPVAFKNIICRICGKAFTSKMKKRRYCSEICKKIAQKERHTSLIAKSIKKICIKCGKEYMGRNGKYCSRKCNLLDRYQYNSISSDGIALRKCPKCNQIKPLNKENYYPSKIISYGFASWCKICSGKKARQWAASDKGKAIRSKNRKEYAKSDAHKQYIKKMLPARRASEAIRRKIDLPFALSNRMRCLMYSSLRGTKNGHKWQDLVGYSVDDLRHHLEKQFKKGMTWKRFLAGEIHIDHKIPVSAFNFISSNHMDFKQCWALKNLQPMWAHDNQIKHAKLDKHFQPALLI